MSLISASLVLTACGKKTETYKPTGTTAQRPAAKTTLKNPTAPIEDMKKNSNSESNGKNEVAKPTSSREDKSSNKKAPLKIHKLEDDGILKQSNKLTGMLDKKSGFNFSGAANDGLMTYLKSQVDKLPQSKSSKEFASTILDASLISDVYSGDVQIRLKTKSGSILVSGIVNNIQFQKAVTNSSRIKASIKCLDFNQSSACQNVLVRLKSGIDLAYVVLRTSNAALHFDMELSSNVGANYYKLRQFILNTAEMENTNNKIDKKIFETFEVAYGRSGLNLSMIGKNKELISLKTPLLAPEMGSGVNVGARVLKSEEVNPALNTKLLDFNLNLAEIIHSVRMVNNNGLGKVRFVINVIDYGRDEAQSMTVIVKRQDKKILEIDANILN